jgi:hypothetical protein
VKIKSAFFHPPASLPPSRFHIHPLALSFSLASPSSLNGTLRLDEIYLPLV